jgi:hypothetical protein
MGEMRDVYEILFGKLEWKRPLGRPRCRWIDSIRRNFREVGCEDVDWIHLAQDRDQWQILVNMVTNIWAPANSQYGSPSSQMLCN